MCQPINLDTPKHRMGKGGGSVLDHLKRLKIIAADLPPPLPLYPTNIQKRREREQ